MTRVVKEVISYVDDDNNELRSIILTQDGLSIENARFLINFAKKNVDEIIKDLCFYNDIYEHIDREKIVIDVHGFDIYHEKVESLTDYFKKKFPNKYKRIDKSFNKDNFVTKYAVEISDSFMDNKINVISYYVNDNSSEELVQRYPIIPEFSRSVYLRSLFGFNTDVVEYKILNLFMAKIFFEELIKEYDDDKFYDMLDDILDSLSEYQSEFPEKYESVSNDLSYTITEQESICNNIELFYQYEIQKFIKNKKIDALKDLQNILFESDTDKPNFEILIKNISDFIKKNCSNDEYVCFNNMKRKYSKEFIVSTCITYFYTLSNTKEFKELFKDNGGNQRTLS